MSQISNIERISKDLGEPEWLLDFRKERGKTAKELPEREKYGIGILGIAHKGEEYQGEPTYLIDASKGLEIYTWKEAVAQEEIEPYLKRLINSEFFPTGVNKFTEEGLSLFSSGLVVYVQPNIDEQGQYHKETLKLKTTLAKGTTADIVIVIAKEGSRLAFENIFCGGGSGSALARTMVFLLENESRIDVKEKTSIKEGTRLFLVSRSIVPAYSSFHWKEIAADSSFFSSHTESWLIGEKATTDIIHGIVTTRNASFDICASVRHCASHTTSLIRSAGIGANQSSLVYRGLIDVPPNISFVSGKEEAQFLSLGPKAKIHTIPSIDIASKDISCSHKVSVSHIRDQDVFYQKLRGLSDAQSREIYLEGYFSSLFTEDENREIIKKIGDCLSASESES